MSASGMSASGWTTNDIPDQTGRVALITGANTGLGLVTAHALAARGATVILACRDHAKGSAAAARIRAVTKAANLDVVRLDLASLAAIREASTDLHHRYERIDLLVNNAGLMIPPYGLTTDGFESQFGTNHLGHFALTGLLLDLLRTAPGSRVVTVSSNGHKRGRIAFDDLRSERKYDPMTAYCQSKLANLMFTYALQRRLEDNHAGTISVAAHPGAARTDLMRHSPPPFRFVVSRRTRWLFSWLIQDEAAGALPILRAATDPALRGGEYLGPDGWKEFTGRYPVLVDSIPASHDVVAQERLWAESERLTGVAFEGLQIAAMKSPASIDSGRSLT